MAIATTLGETMFTARTVVAIPFAAIKGHGEQVAVQVADAEGAQ